MSPKNPSDSDSPKTLSEAESLESHIRSIPPLKETVRQDWSYLPEDTTHVGGTIDDLIAFLITRLTEQRKIPRSEWKPPRPLIHALVLDVMCASFPDKHGPPPNLIELMRLALDLPASHRVGAWAVWSRGRSSQGGADHRAHTTAKLLDAQHYREHGSLMGLRTLAQKTQQTLNLPASPDRKSLREWRKEWQTEWQSDRQEEEEALLGIDPGAHLRRPPADEGK